MSTRLCSSERNMMGSISSSIHFVQPVSVDWWLPAELTKPNFSSLAGSTPSPSLEPFLPLVYAPSTGFNT